MKAEENKLKLEKLTIEITGKPIAPHVRVLADGKPIGCLHSLKLHLDPDDILVDVEVIQTKSVTVDGKKEIVKEPLILKWSNK